MSTFIIMAAVFLLAGMLGKAGGKQNRPPGRPTGGGGQPPLRPRAGQPMGRPKTLREIAEEMMPGEIRWDTRMPIDPAYNKKAGQTGDEDPNKEIELVQSSGKEGEWGDEGRSLPEPLGSEGRSVGLPGPEGTILEAQPDKGLTEPSGVSKNRPLTGPINQQDLAQAVVWAEVLGKPRALKPFGGPRR